MVHLKEKRKIAMMVNSEAMNYKDIGSKSGGYTEKFMMHKHYRSLT